MARGWRAGEVGCGPHTVPGSFATTDDTWEVDCPACSSSSAEPVPVGIGMRFHDVAIAQMIAENHYRQRGGGQAEDGRLGRRRPRTA